MTCDRKWTSPNGNISLMIIPIAGQYAVFQTVPSDSGGMGVEGVTGVTDDI